MRHTFSTHPEENDQIKVQATAYRQGVYDRGWIDLQIGTDVEITLHNITPQRLKLLGLKLAQAAADLAQQIVTQKAMRDPAYVPTLQEALFDPEGFVAGMTEEQQTHCGIPPNLRRKSPDHQGYPDLGDPIA